MDVAGRSRRKERGRMSRTGVEVSRTDRSEGGGYEPAEACIRALLTALVVRPVLFEPFDIPAGSLIPTLLIGGYLFVSKYSSGYSRHSGGLGPPIFSGRIFASEPKRGDLAV